jgi:hypothetical protein
VPLELNERYVVDAEGRQVAVLLDIANFHRLLEELEELAAIRAYDDAKAADDEVISLEDALEEIERDRS